MLEWLGAHRGLYVLFVLVCFALLSVGIGLGPLRRSIDAWRDRRSVPENLVGRVGLAAMFAVYGSFLVMQVATAAWHIWLPMQVEYAIWLLGALALPALARWEVEQLCRRYLMVERKPNNNASSWWLGRNQTAK